MTGADASNPPGTRVRVLVSEPVAQELDGGRQGVETRGGRHSRKVTLEDSVAGNARLSRGLPFGPLDATPAPAAQPELCETCGVPKPCPTARAIAAWDD